MRAHIWSHWRLSGSTQDHHVNRNTYIKTRGPHVPPNHVLYLKIQRDPPTLIPRLIAPRGPRMHPNLQPAQVLLYHYRGLRQSDATPRARHAWRWDDREARPMARPPHGKVRGPFSTRLSGTGLALCNTDHCAGCASGFRCVRMTPAKCNFLQKNSLRNFLKICGRGRIPRACSRFARCAAMRARVAER